MSKEKGFFKNTKVGRFLASKAPHLLDIVDDYFPPLKVITSLITNDEKMDKVDKEQALELLKHYEKEMDYSLENTKSARELYALSKDTTDRISNNIIRYNILFAIGLTIANFIASNYFDNTLTVALSQLTGHIVQALLTERSTIINYFFGSMVKDKKEN